MFDFNPLNTLMLMPALKSGALRPQGRPMAPETKPSTRGPLRRLFASMVAALSGQTSEVHASSRLERAARVRRKRAGNAARVTRGSFHLPHPSSRIHSERNVD